MTSNMQRFKDDLEKLLTRGEALHHALLLDCYGDRFKAQIKASLKAKADKFIDALPNFKKKYQPWYTESLAIVRQLIPDRAGDFIKHYEKPKARKDISYESYRIDDYLQSLQVTRGGEVVVDTSAAVPHFDQQLAILRAAEARFESSLFDIRQVLQADLFDSELEAAEHLAKYKFTRAAGALAGVVLERHLIQVKDNHAVPFSRKNPTISDLHEALRAGGVIDLPTSRFIQHLADIRNLCDHAKTPDPTIDQVQDLLNGVKKVIKTVL
ncbi:hypothetical protein ACTJKJ_12455 [Roseateles sp. 22389]|uniref:hypothetical protein n=1 Tax=Roseateles sp. 22389 TaxID=3453916 RepID=UPI003F83D950